MKGPKKARGLELKAAIEEAAKLVASDELGEYKVEFTVTVGNPKIKEYTVTLIPLP